MSLHIFRVLSVVVGLAIGASAQAAPGLRIRVLDYQTWQPWAGVKISVLVPDERGEVRSDSKRSIVKTDKKGVAVLPMPTGIPVLWVGEGEWADVSCTTTQQFSLRDWRERGIVGDISNDGLCKAAKLGSLNPHPAEVVLFARRLNPWLHFRRVMHETFHD